MHWGYKISILKNDSQIGYFLTGKSIKDNLWDMLLVCDDNANIPLILLSCLHISSDFTSENNSSDGGHVNYNVSLQLKKVDRKWRPNMK